VGFVLWYAGAARISGAEAGLTTALVPVSAVAFAALVLREPVGAAQLAGVACVLGAVLLATFGRMRATRSAA
jgi:drug/metabolite transporter (DMT)-like permease